MFVELFDHTKLLWLFVNGNKKFVVSSSTEQFKLPAFECLNEVCREKHNIVVRNILLFLRRNLCALMLRDIEGIYQQIIEYIDCYSALSYKLSGAAMSNWIFPFVSIIWGSVHVLDFEKKILILIMIKALSAVICFKRYCPLYLWKTKQIC